MVGFFTHFFLLLATAAAIFSYQSEAIQVVVQDMAYVPATPPFLIDIFEYSDSRRNPLPKAVSEVEEAQEICTKQGKRLPTVTQWLTAASGNGKNQWYSLQTDTLEPHEGAWPANIYGTKVKPTHDFSSLGIDVLGTVAMTGNRAEWAVGPNGEPSHCGGSYDVYDLNDVELSRICRPAAQRRHRSSPTVRCVAPFEGVTRTFSSWVKGDLQKFHSDQGPGASAFSENSITHEQVSITSDAEIAAFITHASANWDSADSSKKGVQQFLNKLADFNRINGNKIRTFHLVDTFPNLSSYFWQDYRSSLIISSKSGGHSVRLEKIKRIYLLGGYFNDCLARTLRDILVHTRTHKHPIEIVLIEDGIFIERGNLPPQTLEAMFRRTSPSGTLQSLLETYFSTSGMRFLDYWLEGDDAITRVDEQFYFTFSKKGHTVDWGFRHRPLRAFRLGLSGEETLF